MIDPLPDRTVAGPDTDLGPGRWVSNEDMSPATKISGRWGRYQNGHMVKFGAAIPHSRVVEWFFPDDTDSAN